MLLSKGVGREWALAVMVGGFEGVSVEGLCVDCILLEVGSPVDGPVEGIWAEVMPGIEDDRMEENSSLAMAVDFSVENEIISEPREDMSGCINPGE